MIQDVVLHCGRIMLLSLSSPPLSFCIDRIAVSSANADADTERCSPRCSSRGLRSRSFFFAILRDPLRYLAMIPAVTAALVYGRSIAWNWQSMRSYRFASRIVKPRDLSLRLSAFAAARNRELIRRRREHSFGRLLVPSRSPGD